jgi:hypothetical protein
MTVGRSRIGGCVLSRTRVITNFSTSKTLVPFLYQTPTIQQWKPAEHAVIRRNASSSSYRDHDIPFEDETLPPSIENHAASSDRQRTLTGTERLAFEKLYIKFSKKEQRVKDGHLNDDESDLIADEWYEEDDENDSASLDSVFDSVLAGRPAPGKKRKEAAHKKLNKKPPENLKTLAESILRPEVERARRKPKVEAAAEAAKIKAVREQEKTRVQGLLMEAKTDRELWEVLEREVFEVIRALDLDGIKKSIKEQTAKGATAIKNSKDGNTTSSSPAGNHKRFPTSPTATPWKPSNTTDPRYDPRILFPNFPSHLLFATRLLRKNFPASPLALSILPTIKSLGRSSYALGATTQLYNLLIRTAWTQYSSYTYIDELLTDMENGGVEFDTSTVSILDNICAEYRDARRGRLGRPLSAIYRMDYYASGIEKLEKWRDVIVERLGMWAEQRASEGALVRKFDDTRGARGIAPVRGRTDDFGFAAKYGGMGRGTRSNGRVDARGREESEVRGMDDVMEEILPAKGDEHKQSA